MVTQALENLTTLYEADETAWLEAMAELVYQGRYEELDYPNLGEYLSDMALRDRKEVSSRLKVLITHLLKWFNQPENRTQSWRGSIVAQRQELAKDVKKGVLRKHAETVLQETYAESVELAAAETGLPEAAFPQECPWTLDELLARDLLKN